MNLSPIDMPASEAQRRFEAYERAARQRHDVELEAIRDGYAALADGHQLIDLHDALAAGGVDEHARPRLAIARAHLRWIHLYASISEVVYSTAADRWQSNDRRRGRTTVRVPGHVFSGRLRWTSARAAVPVVPPDLIPTTPNGRLASLRHFHVLWEAEWAPIAPVDPALLRHVGGSLYVLLATWDLTELERAVMSRRFVA